jgi:hypothetical protein
VLSEGLEIRKRAFGNDIEQPVLLAPPGTPFAPLHWDMPGYPHQGTRIHVTCHRRKMGQEPRRTHPLLQRLGRLPVTADDETNEHAWSGTRALSRQYGLTVYDAASLELAIRRAEPLATCDAALAAAAKSGGVAVLTAWSPDLDPLTGPRDFRTRSAWGGWIVGA